MRRTMTARQRLAVFANVSRIQSDQETYDMAVNRDVELKRQRVRAERAEAERDALRADAERYRWLRGDTSPGSERWSRWNLQRWDGTCWHSLERVALDAAIDAALAREEVV